MPKLKEYFDLHIETLRILGKWAADCAERALPIFEELHAGDARPRAAIEGMRIFAAGGKRTAQLRVLALDAYRAAIETRDPAAAAAAQAASLAAAAAFTHPLVDVQQTRHIVGPAAYAALAIELKGDCAPLCGDEEVRRAIEEVGVEVCELLRKMPARTEGKSRLDNLMFAVDTGLRNRFWPVA